MEKWEQIQKRFQEAGLVLSEKQAGQFAAYAELLVQWNEKMNLTSITDFDEILEKHFLDSLAAAIRPVLPPDVWKGNLVDVGTGAGFPGIPLKIYYPDLKVTLLDSLNKRVGFLDQVIRELGLKKITAVHGRAEDLAKDPRYREQFGLCVSRAVAALPVLAEYCLPFVRRGGFLVAYKSGQVEEELTQGGKAVKVLGGSLQKTEKFVLPGTDISRSLVLIRKVENTPKKYPRKAGTPAKQPLG